MPPMTLRLPAGLLLVAAASSAVMAAERRPEFGHQIAVCEDLVLISAPYADEGRGQVYLFRRERNSHRLLKEFKHPAQRKNRFGKAVGLDGDTLVVGDFYAQVAFKPGAGAAYVYDVTKLGEVADEPQRVAPPDPERYSRFGEWIAISGNRVAIGEAERNDGGSVTLFRRNENRWAPESTLNATQLDSGSMSVVHFGESIAMNQTTLVVGAPWTKFGEARKGAAFVYQANDNGRFEDAPTVLSWKDRQYPELFGYGVAVGEDFIVVGAMMNNSRGRKESGAACVYVRGEDGRFPAEPTTLLTADEPREKELFGGTAVVTGRRIVFGGAHGVYVFEPCAEGDTRWKQVARIEGADERAGFGGWGLAATDSLIYVGEPYSISDGKHNGQVAVIAREMKNGKLTFRRIETIAIPE